MERDFLEIVAASQPTFSSVDYTFNETRYSVDRAHTYGHVNRYSGPIRISFITFLGLFITMSSLQRAVQRSSPIDKLLTYILLVVSEVSSESKVFTWCNDLLTDAMRRVCSQASYATKKDMPTMSCRSRRVENKKESRSGRDCQSLD